MRVLVGVDVGYGYTKVYAGKNLRFKFPSLVSADPGELLDRTNVVRFNGQEFVVGVGGRDLRSDEFPFTSEYRALLYYAIANLLDRCSGRAEEVVVGLGVPPVFRSKREEIRKKLSRKVEVEVSGRKYSFLLKPVVFLQGWGGYIDHIYTLEGRYVKENDVPAIYSDWGFYTIDTVVTRRVWTADGEKVVPSLPETPTIKKGVSSLYQLYSRLVADKEGVVVPDLRTAERMFLQNRFPQLIRKAVEIWKREVIEEILMRYREHTYQIEKIVVFGGGASFIDEEFKVGDYPVIKLDEYANARGYFKALPSALKMEGRR